MGTHFSPDKLRAIRESRGISQEQLSLHSGHTRQVVIRTERGHTSPTLNTLGDFAQALGVDVWAFFGDATDRNAGGAR